MSTPLTDILGQAGAAAAPVPAGPKSAHAILADAVEGLLDTSVPEAVDGRLGRLELALRNYRLAEKTAEMTPFGSIVETAIKALERGDTVAAAKCLSVLRLAGDYVPAVDIAGITPPKAPDAS